MTEIASILWRRLDAPGHDACRLEQLAGGWRLSGKAVFRTAKGLPAGLGYDVRCDGEWRVASGRVEGFIGSQPVGLTVSRQDGKWLLNGSVQPGLEHLTDLDIGFSPATNLIPLRRHTFKRNIPLELPAAWLDVEAGTLAELPQTYEWLDTHRFRYRASSVGYDDILDVSAHGFVRDYPGLWTEIA